jgi:hygromycin-B 7''-O-kinase
VAHTPLLPVVADADAFRALRHADIYRPALAEIARRHGLAGEATRYAGGSLPVFALGDEHVVKLFPPPFRRNRDNERDALAFLGGRLAVATPALRAADDLDGWPYLVMAQLPGRRMDEVWPSLERAARLRLAAQVGAMIGELHSLPAGGETLPFAHVVWDAFIEAQRAACAGRQASRGADPAWVARIPAFLAALELGDARAPVFLHTEVMPDHLLVAGDGRLSGLVDFEPSMIGAREYEFASVGLFFAAGDRELLRAVLDEAGCPRDAGLSRRLCGYALLHRYSHLGWYLERMPPRPGVDSFDALAAQWFAH